MSKSHLESRSTIEAKANGGLKWKAFLFTLVLFVFLEVALVMYAGLNTTRQMIAVRTGDEIKQEVITKVKINLGLIPEGQDAELTDNMTLSANDSQYLEYVTVNNTLLQEGFAALYAEMCEAYFIPRTIKADASFNDVFARIVVRDVNDNDKNNDRSMSSSDRVVHTTPPHSSVVNRSHHNNSSLPQSRVTESSLPKKQPCPCVPPGLVGHTNINMHVPYLGEMELNHPEIHSGGHWEPPNCLARHRTAIIIPFRDREEHLTILLNYLHPMLQNQMLYYTIFVVEQVYPAVFNKASIMNTGYREATLADSFDCFIFHDVDMIPENDFNFYTCTPMPRHVGSHCDKFGYKVPYPNLFGGVTAFTSEQFQKANGFSNEYYGWGGEDDDMFQRLKASDMNISRFPSNIARYTMIKHGSDAGNPYNSRSYVAWSSRPVHYKQNGVNTLKYYRREKELRPLYTWILVELPDPRPPEQTNNKKKNDKSASGSSEHNVPCYSVISLMLVIYALLLNSLHQWVHT